MYHSLVGRGLHSSTESVAALLLYPGSIDKVPSCMRPALSKIFKFQKLLHDDKDEWGAASAAGETL